MIDRTYAAATHPRKSRIPSKFKSVFSTIVMWLTLLLIGILAIPAFLFLSLIGALWELADAAIRAIDS